MSHHTLIVLPVVLPLATAALCVLLGSGRRPQWIGLLGAVLNLLVAVWLVAEVHTSGILVTRLGGLPAPFGIAFAADRLAAAMVLGANVVGVLGILFAMPTLLGPSVLSRFVPLLHLMLAGMGGFFLTADLFNFYVWFELLLVSSFGMMVLNGERGRIEGTTKYFAINTFGSLLLLTGIGLIYGLTGTLDFADLALRLQAHEQKPLITAVAALILVALGIKSAAFPLFFWLPASYHAPPIAVTAIFGGVLTKVGVYGLTRLFTLLFVAETAITHQIIIGIGTVTMVAGVLGAVAQQDLRRLLSFHIISQIGYMLVALGFYTVSGTAAAIFFIFHIITVKTALFFVSGVVERLGGSFALEDLGGLYGARPAIALMFLAPALSLAGVPPLSGFVAKLFIVQSGLAAGRPLVVAAALAVSLLTLYSMAKIWTQAFWAPAPAAHLPHQAPLPLALWAPAAFLGLLAVVLGVAAEPVLEYANAAAVELMHRQGYIDALLAGVAP